MENQFQFKPFDKVLVRSTNESFWRTNFFSHINTDRCCKASYCCVAGNWIECIPYNKETAHLLGTNEPYIKPEPKEWYIDSRDGLEKYDFTTKEFEQFLTNAVVNNKDVTDFRVRYVPNN